MSSLAYTRTRRSVGEQAVRYGLFAAAVGPAGRVFAFEPTPSTVGLLRANVVRSLLLLNHVALRGRRFAVALDNRGFALLTATRPLDASTAESFAAELEYLLGQAKRTRELFGFAPEVGLRLIERFQLRADGAV